MTGDIDIARTGRGANTYTEIERHKNSILRQNLYKEEKRNEHLTKRVKELELELKQKNELLGKLRAKLIVKSRADKRIKTKD